jgi:hypothetical protein
VRAENKVVFVDTPALLPNIPLYIDKLGGTALHVGRLGADGLLKSVPVNCSPSWRAPVMLVLEILLHVVSSDLVSDPVGMGLGDCMAIDDELYCLAWDWFQT